MRVQQLKGIEALEQRVNYALRQGKQHLRFSLPPGKRQLLPGLFAKFIHYDGETQSDICRVNTHDLARRIFYVRQEF